MSAQANSSADAFIKLGFNRENLDDLDYYDECLVSRPLLGILDYIEWEKQHWLNSSRVPLGQAFIEFRAIRDQHLSTLSDKEARKWIIQHYIQGEGLL